VAEAGRLDATKAAGKGGPTDIAEGTIHSSAAAFSTPCMGAWLSEDLFLA
jgi:hypothetical protein